MKSRSLIIIILLFCIPIISLGEEMKKSTISLPSPVVKGKVSLEESLEMRRSIRDYSADSLTLEQLSQLLWAAQGLTKDDFYRTAPSAGALYPLEVYAAVERVKGLEPGLYNYIPKGHKMKLERRGKLLGAVADAALGQSAIRDCAVCFIITGVISRTSKKYGERAEQYVLIEVGHAGQNLLLQAAALGLGAVPMGAFYEDKLLKALGLKGEPYYLIPVGRR